MSWPAPGRVADGKFPRAFGALVTGHFSGILRLDEGEDRAHALYWQDGAIVDADSRSPEDTFGRVALDAGLIDNATLGEAIRRLASNPARPQKEILVEMGALPPESLERACRLTLTRRALRAFAMPEASYAVSEETHGRSEGGPVEPRWTLYRGLRLHYDEPRLVLELEDLAEKAIKLAAEGTAHVDRFGFSDEERILLAYLAKGYWELEDLVEACLTMPRAVVLAAVAALRAVDTLDVQKASSVPRLRKRARETTLQMSREALKPLHANQLGRPSSSQPVVRPPTQPPAGARPSSQPPVGPRPATIPPVGMRSATQPPGGPKPTSSGQPSVAARLSSSQSSVPPAPRASGSQPVVGVRPQTVPPASSSKPPATNPPLSPPSPSTSGSSLPVVAAPAMTKLMREQIGNKLRQVDGGADHFSVLEITQDASSAQVKAAYFQLAKTYHPDRLALVHLESMRPQVERIFARLSDAYAGLADETRRKEYLQILAQGGETAVKRRNDDELAAATKLLTAEEHFRKGEMALRRRLYPAAVEEFQAAVDLNDREPEHHAYLAWAKWCNAENKDALFPEVKRSLNRAAELSDRCLPAFLFLGQIYIARNELDRAYNMFQRVLSINENHVDAKREVRVLEMRRAKASEKRGLLDLFKKK